MFDRQIIFPLLEARPELFLLKSGAYHTYKRKREVHSVPYMYTREYQRQSTKSSLLEARLELFLLESGVWTRRRCRPELIAGDRRREGGVTIK